MRLFIVKIMQVGLFVMPWKTENVPITLYRTSLHNVPF